MTAMTPRVRSMCERVRRARVSAWGKRQAESGTEDDECGWGTARGAAACAHRRALHSACTSERCGWDARVCWRERVTGSRVRQLQPRLLVQWFSILFSSQQRSILYRAAGNRAVIRRKPWYCYYAACCFFVAIVCAVLLKLIFNEIKC